MDHWASRKTHRQHDTEHKKLSIYLQQAPRQTSWFSPFDFQAVHMICKRPNDLEDMNKIRHKWLAGNTVAMGTAAGRLLWCGELSITLIRFNWTRLIMGKLCQVTSSQCSQNYCFMLRCHKWWNEKFKIFIYINWSQKKPSTFALSLFVSISCPWKNCLLSSTTTTTTPYCCYAYKNITAEELHLKMQ